VQQSESRDNLGQTQDVPGVLCSSLSVYPAKLRFPNLALVLIVSTITASLRANATRAFQLPLQALRRKPHCFNAIEGDARYKITVATSNSSFLGNRSLAKLGYRDTPFRLEGWQGFVVR